MKMSITITDAEVREAIVTWLDDHGVPSHSFEIRATSEGGISVGNTARYEVLVKAEAPHMEGPYR